MMFGNTNSNNDKVFVNNKTNTNETMNYKRKNTPLKKEKWH